MRKMATPFKEEGAINGFRFELVNIQPMIMLKNNKSRYCVPKGYSCSFSITLRNGNKNVTRSNVKFTRPVKLAKKATMPARNKLIGAKFLIEARMPTLIPVYDFCRNADSRGTGRNIAHDD